MLITSNDQVVQDLHTEDVACLNETTSQLYVSSRWRRIT